MSLSRSRQFLLFKHENKRAQIVSLKTSHISPDRQATETNRTRVSEKTAVQRLVRGEDRNLARIITRPDTWPIPVADGWAGAETLVIPLFDSCSLGMWKRSIFKPLPPLPLSLPLPLPLPLPFCSSNINSYPTHQNGSANRFHIPSSKI